MRRVAAIALVAEVTATTGDRTIRLTRRYPTRTYAARTTKPLTASVACTPISVPGIRLPRRRKANIPPPINAAGAISVALIRPNDAVP